MNLKTWTSSVIRARDCLGNNAEWPLTWQGWSGGDHVFLDAQGRFFTVDLVTKTFGIHPKKPTITTTYREGAVVSVPQGSQVNVI